MFWQALGNVSFLEKKHINVCSTLLAKKAFTIIMHFKLVPKHYERNHLKKVH